MLNLKLNIKCVGRRYTVSMHGFVFPYYRGLCCSSLALARQICLPARDAHFDQTNDKDPENWGRLKTQICVVINYSTACRAFFIFIFPIPAFLRRRRKKAKEGFAINRVFFIDQVFRSYIVAPLLGSMYPKCARK